MAEARGNARKVVLLDEAHEVFCRAVCAWTGVPLPEPEARHRTRQLAALIEGPGGVALRYVRGRLDRKRADDWIADLVDRVRSGELGSAEEPSPWSPIIVSSTARSSTGRWLRSRS